MITLVNYGLGNIQAFANIYKRLNIPVAVANTSDELVRAEKIILPGVGAFDWAMTRLNESGMRACLDDLVLVQKRPILGVCVGMQMMAKRSDEGKLPGLGWIDAEVRHFGRGVERGDVGVEDKGLGGRELALPHMGWNDVSPQKTDCLFKGMPTGARFYFLHSYYFLAQSYDAVLAMTDYNGPFASAVCSGNMVGTQFHPEKSHQWGIQLLKNFADL
jgi:imidazole glycerol-phosphate synthase subunit HisH